MMASLTAPAVTVAAGSSSAACSRAALLAHASELAARAFDERLNR